MKVADWQALLALAGARRVAALTAFSLAAGVVELLGALALVPLLSEMGPAGAGAFGGGIATALVDWARPFGLVPLLAVFVITVVLRAWLQHRRALASLECEIAVVDTLRARAFAGLLDADWRALSAMRQTRNRALLISSIDRVGYLAQQAGGALMLVSTLGALMLAALLLSPFLAIAAVVLGLLVLLAYRGMRQRARALGEQVSEAYTTIHAELDESLGALRLIKSLGREREARHAVDSSFADLRGAQRRLTHDLGTARIVLHGGGALGLALLSWWALDFRGLALAVVLPLLAVLVRALPLLGALQEMLQHIAASAPAWRESRTLLAEVDRAREFEGAERPVAQSTPLLARQLVVDDVHFSHRADRAALAGVSLEIGSQEVVAIEGPSGSGKSTLADIVGGLLSPDRGRVLLDGVMIDEGRRANWRARVSYVQQEPLLPAPTIRANLAWGDSAADDGAMAQVLEQAGAGFVFDLPDALDTQLGEFGRTLSGGERQRIALARALLRQPELLILDEATSALDPEADAVIAQTVSRLRGRFAIVVFAHRGALLDVADRRFRLADGRLLPL